MRTFAAAVALTAALLAGGCDGGPACPAIAQAPGVSLTVAQEYAGEVEKVRLKACQDGRCTEADVPLFPGSAPLDEGCEPGRPDDHGECSATSVPDGTLTGLLMVDVLTASTIEVTLSGTGPGGLPLPVRILTFNPQVTHPFGEKCGRFISANVVLDAAGLRQEGPA